MSSRLNQCATLFQRINSFLTNDKIRLNLAFVLKTDEQLGEPTNDALFTNFIEFVEAQLKLDLTQKVGLILVLPNPKVVFGEEEWRMMRSNKSKDRNFIKNALKIMCTKIFPQHTQFLIAGMSTNAQSLFFTLVMKCKGILRELILRTHEVS